MGSKGVDIIVEMAANKNLDADIGLLGRRGRIIVSALYSETSSQEATAATPAICPN